ncbi:MAG: hypothetical protein ACOYL6_01535 [Bacteriovoracaceae bacterium]
MKYCGFNQHEIEKIEAILSPLGVVYEISPYQAAIEAVNSSMKYDLRHLHGASVDNSLLQIEINDLQLNKIPPEYVKPLEDLRIFLNVGIEEGVVGTDQTDSLPGTLLSLQRNGFQKNLAVVIYVTFGLSFLITALVFLFEFLRQK